ncbi:MAG: hypothetical protein FWB91_00350 [Defluviitaleaceae bacterium]|nr:hypothetical protein [Defluviitaleaceae bacterium]
MKSYILVSAKTLRPLYINEHPSSFSKIADAREAAVHYNKFSGLFHGNAVIWRNGTREYFR